MVPVTEPPFTFDEYKFGVRATHLKRPSWRSGQTYFNVLYEIRPDLSEQIRATDLDPFYNDTVLPLFLQWVETHWNASPCASPTATDPPGRAAGAGEGYQTPQGGPAGQGQRRNHPQP